MKLSEIFDQLTYGELSSLFMGGVDCVKIQSDSYPQVVSYINAALRAIYTRFPLKTEQVTIKLEDHIQVYYLKSQYAKTNTDSTEPYKYIDDSVYLPFQDNVIEINQIFNEDGQTLFINNGDEYWSVHTPSYNSIQIPYPEKENSLIVMYRANHPVIAVKDLVPEEEEIDIPLALLEAFLFYVGSRAFTNLNADQNAEGNNYAALYENSCRKVQELGLIPVSSNANTKLRKSGWT